MSRAAAEGLAAELWVWPADGAGRRAVAVELAVALSLALAAVHFFWCCCGTRRLARALAKSYFLLLFGFFLWASQRQDSEIAALEACDKSGSARSAEATLQLCGLWNAPIIRGCGGPRNNESRWLWTRTRRRKLGASSPENTGTGRIEREKPVEDQSFDQNTPARCRCGFSQRADPQESPPVPILPGALQKTRRRAPQEC